MSAEAVAEVDRDEATVDYKLDVTVGVTLANHRKMFMQVQMGAPHGDEAFVRLAPSVVFPMGPNRHLELGLSVGLRGDDQLGIKLGIWQKF